MKEGNTLVISSTDFETREVNVSGQNGVTVKSARHSPGAIDEVIVTAGDIKTRRKKLSTANTVIWAETLTAGKGLYVAGDYREKLQLCRSMLSMVV